MSLKSQPKYPVKAWAPATVANVIVGFDMLGFPLNDIGDSVEVRKISECNVVIDHISAPFDLPHKTQLNTASVALSAMRKALNLNYGFAIKINKGIPLGSGMGGSAASAVAAVVAANEFLKKPLSREKLLPFALAGEKVASQAAHADNVGPALFGGLVFSSANGKLLNIPAPSQIEVVVMNPGFVLATKESRRVLPRKVEFSTCVRTSAYLGGFLIGCFRNDKKIIAENMSDLLIEPYRAPLIPGYHDMKEAALRAGALSAGIAGAGPSIFAWCEKKYVIQVERSLTRSAKSAGHQNVRTWVSRINLKGAIIKK